MMPARYLRRYLSHVILHVTNRCQLRCGTCFVQKGQADLALAEARRIAGKLGRVAWLDIGGGEPFLHPDLVDICAAFDTPSITVPTNGQAPDLVVETTRAIRAAIRGSLTIALSIDGFPEANDAIRGEGSYDLALATLARLKAAPGVTLKVNTVISNANVESLLPFVRHVRALGPDYHSVIFLRGLPASDALRLPDLAVLRGLEPDILQVLRSYDYGAQGRWWFKRLAFNYQRYVWNLSIKTLATKRAWVRCRAPLLHKVVYPDGQVAMCELMPPIGNILNEPVDVLERRMREQLHAHETQHEPCYCTHNCNLADNLMMSPVSALKIVLGIMP